MTLNILAHFMTSERRVAFPSGITGLQEYRGIIVLIAFKLPTLVWCCRINYLFSHVIFYSTVVSLALVMYAT